MCATKLITLKIRFSYRKVTNYCLSVFRPIMRLTSQMNIKWLYKRAYYHQPFIIYLTEYDST